MDWINLEEFNVHDIVFYTFNEILWCMRNWSSTLEAVVHILHNVKSNIINFMDIICWLGLVNLKYAT